MITKHIHAIALAVSFLLTVCSASATDDYGDAAAEALARKHQLVIYKTNMQNVRFDLDVSPREAKVGTPIKFVFKLVNVSDKPIFLKWRNQYDRPFTWVTAGPTGRVWQDPDVGNCPAESGAIPLAAGKSYERVYEWDQQKFFGPSDTGEKPQGQVPPGDYVIVAKFNLENSMPGGYPDLKKQIHEPMDKMKVVGAMAKFRIVK